jgi:hypothetical protein
MLFETAEIDEFGKVDVVRCMSGCGIGDSIRRDLGLSDSGGALCHCLVILGGP